MVYFVSDIHLGGGSPHEARRVESAFCRWIDSVADDARAIYLMGDIFDFWFEYNRVVPQGFTRVFGRLAALTDRGVEVHMFVGNHDMWARGYLERECGVVMHYAPELLTIGSCRMHLAHGDNMNIKGQPMLRLMNGFFRSGVARWLFRWLVHPDLAMRFGYWWSGKSRKSHSKDSVGPGHLGFLIDYARTNRALGADADTYIFGHMHLAHEHREEGLRVLFLSDWSGSSATYAAMNEEGEVELKTFLIDETIS
jgi:UDP-2,3-diacylglucosamine hydrolase